MDVSGYVVKGCVVVRKELFEEALREKPRQGKKLLEPLKSFCTDYDLPLQGILEDTDTENVAEVHTHEGDWWECVEGEIEFIVGGELIDPYYAKRNAEGTIDYREIKAKEIKGGMSVILKAGDSLWIPPGVPHHHFKNGTARLKIIKIPK